MLFLHVLFFVYLCTCVIVVSATTGEGIDPALFKLGGFLFSNVPNSRTADFLPIKKFTDNVSMKVVFVGPEKFGTKTTFINRYISGSFTEPAQKRSAIATEMKKLRVNGAIVNVNLTDAPGNEKSFSPYLKTAHAAVVGYDITSNDSFSSCCKMCDYIRTKFPNVIIMVVGGMSDRASSRCVPSDEAKASSKAAGAKLFFEG